MERRVYETALEGDVATLKRLLHEDPLILDRTTCMVNIYSETPLHVASMLGHHDFAKEILRKKPELAKELDSKKSSPLHLAAVKGHIDVVRALADPEMCMARDRDGITPVHLAAMKGRLDVLKELIDAISINGLVDMMAVDDQLLGESILHMCVKHSQLEALKIMVEMIGDGGGDFVNYRDAFGNTILHLAVIDKQIETVKYLVMDTTIEVNAQNLNGLTAMDILLQTRNDAKEMDIAELLRDKGAKQASKHIMQPSENTKKSHKKKKSKRKKPISNNSKPNAEHWVQKMRDALMIAASLLATMAFQAVVSPPGGLLQNNDTPIIVSEIQNDINSFNPFKGVSESYVTFAPAAAPSSGVSDTKVINGTIGKSVMSYYEPPVYNMFLVANTLSFLASLSIILLLISGLPVSRKFFMYIMMIIMWVAITGMGLSYFACINMITPEGKNVNIAHYLYVIGACLLAGHAVILALGHTIQMTIKMIKWLCRAFKRKSKMNSTSMDIEDSCDQVYVAA